MTEQTPLAHAGAREEATVVAAAVDASIARALAPLVARLADLERRVAALEGASGRPREAEVQAEPGSG